MSDITHDLTRTTKAEVEALYKSAFSLLEQDAQRLSNLKHDITVAIDCLEAGHVGAATVKLKSALRKLQNSNP